MAELPMVALGTDDENADWILTPERRQEEIAIHEELERKHKKAAGWGWELLVKGGPGSGNWRHTGLVRTHGGSDPGGGIGEVVTWNDQQYKEAGAAMTAQSSAWLEGLAREQWDSVDWYSGSGYGVVNRLLRGKKNYAPAAMVDEAKEFTPVLDKTIDQSRLSTSTLVHRGMCSGTISECYRQYSSLEPGDEFTDKGFVSTSVIAQEARPWSGVVCHITLPKGSKAAYLEDISGIGELEVLLPRGSRFRVVGRRQEGGNASNARIHFDLVLMAQEEPPPPAWETGTASKGAKEPLSDRGHSDKFTWELGDIEITKKADRMKGYEWKLEVIPDSNVKGGPGSGHHGHAGRPGKRGGSAPGKGGGGGVAKETWTPANPAGKDSLSQYRLPDGSWTPERQALHERIKQHFLKGKTPVKNPEAYIMGGGSAAGKSTLIRKGFVKVPENMVTSNSDDIKKLLPEYDEKGAPFVHEESSYLAKQLAREAAAANYNVMLDGTGDSSIEKLKAKVESMAGDGRPIHGIYVTVDTETAVARSMSRAERTGRYVPESVIRASHAGVSRIFPTLDHVDLFDSLRLFDTNDGVKLIAEEINRELVIRDQEAYKRFLAKAEQ